MPPPHDFFPARNDACPGRRHRRALVTARRSNLLPAALMALATCLTSTAADGLAGKVMCGYQGWFRVEGDGSNNGWHHYAPGQSFKPGHATIDLWPDVRELPEPDQFPTDFRHPDGSVARVFSSVRPSTVRVHFDWMRTYGIDGIFLQRFAVSARDPKFRVPMDGVMDAVRKAARETGRQWVLMYDLSGLRPGRIREVAEDWQRLQASPTSAIAGDDPSYLQHRNRPLVALWGLGFNDRPAMLDEWRWLIDFFKSDARPGGCSVMLGVPAYWRTLDRDAIPDPALHELIKQADVLSPWTVGRYDSPEAATRHATTTLKADLDWCARHTLDYLPVAFPGFSWHNLSASRGKSAPLNAIPRRGGSFLWSQVVQARRAGAKGLYIAMFDELDEATAIFKVRQDPPVGDSLFVSEPDVPGDHYLWLAGQAARAFRGPTDAVADTLPVRSK
jgi:hypothetical protein